MDIVALAVLVVASTQIIKQYLIKIDPNLIAIAMSAAVVVLAALEGGTPISTKLLMVFVKVLVAAVGSFKTAIQVLRPAAVVAPL